MRLPRTISRYLLREAVLYTVIGLVGITTVLVSRNLLRYLDELLAVGFSLADLGAVVRSLFAMLVAYALPVALLFGVLLSISRLAADTEIVAMRACGIGLGDILRPLVVLGIVVSGVTSYLLLEVEHQARRDLRTLGRTMAMRGEMIQAGRFRHLGDRTLFVRERDKTRLGGVVIADRTDPERSFMVFAERGELQLDTDVGRMRFRLENGEIHLEPTEPEGEEARYQRISFDTFDYSFDSTRLLGDDFSRLDPRQMSMSELRSVVARARQGLPLENVREKNPAEYELQIHRRLALPLAPFLFVLISVPLGMRRGRGARSWSAMLCALLAFSYYAILTFSQFLSVQGVLDPAIALWIPNLAFAATAVWLLRRASRIED